MAFIDVLDTARYSDEGFAAKQWQCEFCTFENKSSTMICEMCGNQRKEKEKSAKKLPKWIELQYESKSVRLKSGILNADTQNAFNTLLLFVGYNPNDALATDIAVMICENNNHITDSKELMFFLEQKSSLKGVEIKIVLKSIFANHRYFIFHYNNMQVFKWMPR
eukprot:380766_1